MKSLKRIGAFLVISAFALSTGRAIAQASWPGLRPNIVLILADDLGYGDLGCYGQTQIHTPTIDKLAEEGVRFTQYYAGSTVCAPSRGALMTGFHNGHGRVRDNIPSGISLHREDATVAEVLRDAGYRTGLIGKWGLGQPWNAGGPKQKGFEEFYGYADQDHAHFYYPHFLWDNDKVALIPGNRPDSRDRVYSPDLLKARAFEFLEQSRQDKRPFFLFFSTILPHWSEYSLRSSNSQIVPTDAPYSDRDWPQVEKNYAAMVTRLDRDVGELVKKLDALGIRENTLIIFTSDNGPSAESIHRPDFFKSGGPFRGTKRDVYEGGIRVPLIANWPGKIAAGTTSNLIAAGWDMLPTLAAIAGANAPPEVDGLSFAESLRGEKPARQHEYLYWDYGHTRGQFLQAVRMGNWKGVRKSRTPALELYDLDVDPGEVDDIARQNPAVVKKLESLMAAAFTPSTDYPIKSAANRAGGLK